MELRVRTLKSVFMVASGPFRCRRVFRILKWDGLALPLIETRKGPCPDLQENSGSNFLVETANSSSGRGAGPWLGVGALLVPNFIGHPTLAALGLEGWGSGKGDTTHTVFSRPVDDVLSLSGCCQCDPCTEICQANSPELQKHKLHRPQRSPCQHHNTPTSDLDAVTPPN